MKGPKRAILGNILKILFGPFWPVSNPLKPIVYGGRQAQIHTCIEAVFGRLEALTGYGIAPNPSVVDPVKLNAGMGLNRFIGFLPSFCPHQTFDASQIFFAQSLPKIFLSAIKKLPKKIDDDNHRGVLKAGSNVFNACNLFSDPFR